MLKLILTLALLAGIVSEATAQNRQRSCTTTCYGNTCTTTCY